ncbi:GatB/YqeY domain-containing protein [Dellaglioa algida]|uniref:GatB/YqeY domain-containing protein n=1 Tax=Dellaglioa algida TaxID=105612 RepID=UPI0024C4AEE2|nr:GatB/YqeY domain-containing protein [Dellaglioa algida]MDK1726306.1 GatB/YqeY domain-containing protein [Dellaglioa algida]
MSLLETLNNDLKQAMKAKDKQTLSTVRMLKAAVTNEEIKAGHELSTDDETVLLARELKQRKESYAEFKGAGRDDLLESLDMEIKIVEKYLPEQLSAEEVTDIVKEVISQVGATSKADFGKVMGAVIPKLKGRADGKVISETVKSLLN